MLPRFKFVLAAFISIALTGCLSEGDDAESDADSNDDSPTVLRVTSASPSQGQRNVGVSANIAVVFGGALNQAALDFTVMNGNTPVSGSLTVSGNSATFNPDQNMEYLTSYTINIGGNPNNSVSIEESSWNFMTEAAPSASTALVESTSPDAQETNVYPSRSITVIFDSDVSSSDYDISFSLVDESSNPVSGSLTTNGSSVVFNPTSILSPVSVYTATVGNNIGAQQVIQNFSWSFTTGDPSLGFCNGAYDNTFQFVEGMNNTAPTPSSKPGKGVETTDPAYGTCFVRATDHANEPPVGFARNDYSRRQAFNADDSKFIVYSNNGFWHLYDAITLEHLAQLSGPAGDSELQWHPTDPNRFFYLPNTGGMVINSYDITNNQVTAVANFSGRLPWPNAARAWTKSEGSPSADARYWGFQVETSGYSPLGLMTYDLQTDTIIGTWDFAANGVGRPDHVSMSPSGEYIVASWDSNSYGTTAFSRDFTQNVKLHHKSEHSDIGLLPNGNDVYVSVDFQANGGDLFMVEIQTGVRTDLFRTYVNGTTTAVHISGKAYNNPGWVLVSTYGGYFPAGVGRQWTHYKVFALELAPNPRIYNIMHHQGTVNTYFAEPQASVNRDFTKMLLNSNWGGGTLDVDAYMLILPPDVVN